MNPLYHRHQSAERAQFRNPRGVAAALIVGAALWVCGCGALAIAALLMAR